MVGKSITPKLLAEAMRTLPKENRIPVLLYFFQLSDVEIGQLLDIPGSTVQYRRTSLSMRKLRDEQRNTYWASMKIRVNVYLQS